jgi:hypothetical protein
MLIKLLKKGSLSLQFDQINFDQNLMKSIINYLMNNANVDLNCDDNTLISDYFHDSLDNKSFSKKSQENNEDFEIYN